MWTQADAWNTNDHCSLYGAMDADSATEAQFTKVFPEFAGFRAPAAPGAQRLTVHHPFGPSKALKGR